MAGAMTRAQYVYTAKCPSCGLTVWGGCACLSRYSEETAHVPTERIPYGAPAKCECGSGSNERSGAHSHWCGLWTP